MAGRYPSLSLAERIQRFQMLVRNGRWCRVCGKAFQAENYEIVCPYCVAVGRVIKRT